MMQFILEVFPNFADNFVICFFGALRVIKMKKINGEKKCVLVSGQSD